MVCRREVKQALANAVCGRSGRVLCRTVGKLGSVACTVRPASKCDDEFPTSSACGPVVTCAEACEPPGCSTTSSSTSTTSTSTSTTSTTTVPTLTLANADFDQGHVGWTEDSTNYPGLLIVQGGMGGAPTAHSGTRLAWLGRINDEVSVLSQQVTVPAGVGPSYLRFRYQLSSTETNCNQAMPSDSLTLRINDTQVDGIVLCSTFSTGATWVEFSFVPDFSTWAGQTITVSIRVATDGSMSTSVFLDSLGISSAP